MSQRAKEIQERRGRIEKKNAIQSEMKRRGGKITTTGV
jgi:hypothetical protein